MRILILSSEVWNDKINGNNVVSNWFTGFTAEFANIYLSAGEPFNSCCTQYFQATEKGMLKSILRGTPAGRTFVVNSQTGNTNMVAEAIPSKLYSFLKPVTGSFLRFLREELWIHGKYNTDLLKGFLDSFKPDIIFSERMASCKMLRLEKIVTGLCDAPIVAFTGDDEYSLRQFKFSPFFWINRFEIRKKLREMVKKYKIYYTLSLEQKEDYEKRFKCRCKVLQKCANMTDQYVERVPHRPIRMIYAGKFYCNRWKVLAEIVEELRAINQDSVKIILEIYTRDLPTDKQRRLLDDGKNSFIKGGVTQEELRDIYKNSDIAIHVESQDLKNRLATRLSFSTKIVDCIESGCAILAFCWKQHSGLKYLKKTNAAICVSNAEELHNALVSVVENPDSINEFSRLAYECGVKNHERKKVQDMLMEDFCNVIAGEYN